MLEVVLKSFEAPDETRVFEKGKLEIVRIGGMTIGRASYEPGWRWIEHVSPIVGTSFCEVEHVGMVLSGRAMAAMKDGTEVELTAGSLFYVPPAPHDSWVIGDEPYVSLHFLGADHYAKRTTRPKRHTCRHTCTYFGERVSACVLTSRRCLSTTRRSSR